MLQEKKHQENHNSKANTSKSTDDASYATDTQNHNTKNENDTLSKKQYNEISFYLFIALFVLELVIACVAFFYGIIHAIPDPNGGAPRFQFPWLAYGLAAILAPAGLLLILHLSGLNIFNFRKRGQEHDEAWQAELPMRMRKAYIIIKNAPTAVLLIGILILGVALVYVDGAINIISQLSGRAEKFIPWIIGAMVTVWCVGYVGRVWLNYRTKRLEAEYDFRREIFERTGQIIVEKGSIQLPNQTKEINAISSNEVLALHDGDNSTDMINRVEDDDPEIIDITEDKKQ